MTRRIAISIFLTVLTILVAASVTTYVSTRAVLLANLDQSIAARAASLPQVTDATGKRFTTTTPIRDDDRVFVRNEIGQTIARPDSAANGANLPQVIEASFSNGADGSRHRVVTFRAFGRPAGPEGDGANAATLAAAPIVPVTVMFRASAVEFDTLTRKLAFTLAICGVVGGLLSAGVAWVVARLSLRPLHATAETLGTIDETVLDRRIDTTALPSELRPVGERLNDMLGRIEQSFARRKRFLADAAHELRTPVAAMTTGIEVVLRRPRESAVYHETLTTCLSEVRLMRALVESLMTQARAELAAFDEPLEDVSLRPAIEQVVHSLQPLADERTVTLSFDVPRGLTVRASENRLRSVVMNLVANAIEHNRTGGSVNVETTIDEAAAMAEIRVCDTGPGIAEAHLSHLFEPFYRADASRDEREAKQHLGLGLFLVKTHMAAMRGTCDVQSTLGKGTAFVLRLPIPAAVVFGHDEEHVNHPAPAAKTAGRSADSQGKVSQPFHSVSVEIADNSVAGNVPAVG